MRSMSASAITIDRAALKTNQAVIVLLLVLAWAVIALALLNLVTGFCAGCAIHYRLARWGVRGFARPAATQGRVGS
jgi:hypothetical protein